MTAAGHSASEKVPSADRTGLTGYVILAQDEDRNWRIVGKIAARTAEAAIRAHARAHGTDAGVFVAVADRSWQPVKVTPRVETTLLIEDAS